MKITIKKEVSEKLQKLAEERATTPEALVYQAIEALCVLDVKTHSVKPWGCEAVVDRLLDECKGCVIK